MIYLTCLIAAIFVFVYQSYYVFPFPNTTKWRVLVWACSVTFVLFHLLDRLNLL